MNYILMYLIKLVFYFCVGFLIGKTIFSVIFKKIVYSDDNKKYAEDSPESPSLASGEWISHAGEPYQGQDLRRYDVTNKIIQAKFLREKIKNGKVLL